MYKIINGKVRKGNAHPVFGLNCSQMVPDSTLLHVLMWTYTTIIHMHMHHILPTHRKNPNWVSM